MLLESLQPSDTIELMVRLQILILMECKESTNLQQCNCTYEPCPRKGVCCECVRYHLRNRELPACFFTAETEATFDRSFEHFARLVDDGEV